VIKGKITSAGSQDWCGHQRKTPAKVGMRFRPAIVLITDVACSRPVNAGLYSSVTKRMEYFFFPVPVCVITASGVPGGTFVSMNRFRTLCG
jgi:hypothetical protein